jgi:hypothetical protein
MFSRHATVIGFTLLLGLAFVPAAHASPQFSIHVGIGAPIAPAAVVPVAPAYPGYVWHPGYYEPRAYGRSGWSERWEHERRGWDRDNRYGHDRCRDRGHEPRDNRGSWNR